MWESATYQLRLVEVLVTAALSLAGCQSAYFKTMEKLGYHKRELLVASVKDARESQEEAKEQFQSALEKFSAVLNFNGGELQEKYYKLKGELDTSESKAKAVWERIDDVEVVAEALFYEWESELDQYSDNNPRRASKDKLVEKIGRAHV